MTRKNNIVDSLNKLKEKDVYSKLLLILYRLKDDEKYSTLSSLIWALDKDNLLNFLTIFEGVEIKVPRISDLKMIVCALQVYQLVQLESKDLNESIDEVATNEISKDELKTLYFRILSVVNDVIGPHSSPLFE